ncbi:MAG: histidinol-phosphate transaminase [Burkholderiaceae bacterium]|jgi:histidinol-phosphate aminotransferase|nr:histidinol-phosphate transaminase [Burkholderiaceae bacterium]
MSATGPRPNLSVLRDDVRAIDAYAVPSAAGLLKLDAMENPFPLPPGLMQQVGNRLGRQPLNRYPPADPKGFKERLASAMGVPDGMRLMLGNGSDELIHLVIQACARPDAVVLSPAPSFVMYEMSARFNRCAFVGVPLKPDFTLDALALLAAIEEHRPAVIFLSHPNNPTGNLFDRSVVEQVIRVAPGLVVVDEAYLPFAQDTWMPQIARWPNLLVLRTLSKLGLAGIRLGYLVGHPDWIAQFDKVRPPYNVNVLTLATADLMLENLAILDAQAATLRAERTRLAGALAESPGVTPFPSSANFILFRVEKPDSVFAALKERGILIRNVAGMHPLLAGCLRVTVGTPSENQTFIRALRAVIGIPQ